MAGGVLLALGPHRFQASGPSYETLERTAAARWQAVELIGREPAQQFLGAGEVTISIDGTVYPFLFKGFKELDNIEAETQLGRPLILVSGYGRVFGKFGVREVRRTETMAFTRGEPQKIEFSVSLVRVPGASGAAGAIGRLF